MNKSINKIVKSIFMMMPPQIRTFIINVYRKVNNLDRYSVKRRDVCISGDVSLMNTLSGTKMNVIFFPVIDWHFRTQRPQQIAKNLAKLDNNVIYISTTFNHSKQPGFKILENPEDNIILCSLNLDCSEINIYKDSLSESQIQFLVHGLQILRLSFGFKFTQSIINLPFWRRLVESLPSNHIIYDCMDHHAGFENNDSVMLEEEEKLFKSSDLVITTAQRLSESVSKYCKNTIIRNGGEISYFSRHVDSGLLEKTNPIVGYYGAIAEWFDIELLITCAEAYPMYDFVLIGGVTCDISKAQHIKNIKFLGEVPYRELTKYLKDFDVCIIPFKLIELTLCTNPVKVYEYLAAGKPVVCTAMPEVMIMDNMVHVGNSHREFVALISQAMSEVSNQQLSDDRQSWAMGHDWYNRAISFESEMRKINSCKVSIIVLTFNNLNLTIDCLNSIEKNTKYSNYEVIIVDNLSTDGTRQFLQENYSDRLNYKVILNDENLGFACGNNVGFQYATGDILVILNNDTYVAPFWLGALVKALNNNKELGMVGPVTNNIGNESKINIRYKNWSEMTQLALTYNSLNINKLYALDCLAFFCVAIKREVYESVGGLCTEYGLGFFEDDDYCMRVKQAGWKLACVEDSFVHHHLSASFNKLKNNKKQELMRNNQAIFESKWGEWKPHKYRKGVV